MSDALPSARVLLETIRVFLEKEIAPQVDARSAYLLKVTGNLLDILIRESNTGTEAIERERDGLLGLLQMPPDSVADSNALNRLLCARISDDSLSLESDALWQHLLNTTRDRLSIDNPRYKFSPL